jgi:hypothetical protein
LLFSSISYNMWLLLKIHDRMGALTAGLLLTDLKWLCLFSNNLGMTAAKWSWGNDSSLCNFPSSLCSRFEQESRNRRLSGTPMEDV